MDTYKKKNEKEEKKKKTFQLLSERQETIPQIKSAQAT